MPISWIGAQNRPPHASTLRCTRARSRKDWLSHCGSSGSEVGALKSLMAYVASGPPSRGRAVATDPLGVRLITSTTMYFPYVAIDYVPRAGGASPFCFDQTRAGPGDGHLIDCNSSRPKTPGKRPI